MARITCGMFEELPRELRDQIWIETLKWDGDIVLNSAGKHQLDSQNSLEPPLLRVCEQIRREATPIYYTTNRFRIFIDQHSWQLPVTWLESLSPEKRMVITNFTIQYRFADQLSDRTGDRAYATNTDIAWSGWIKKLAARTVSCPSIEDMGFWMQLPRMLKRLDGFNHSVIKFCTEPDNTDRCMGYLTNRYNDSAGLYMRMILNESVHEGVKVYQEAD